MCGEEGPASVSLDYLAPTLAVFGILTLQGPVFHERVAESYAGHWEKCGPRLYDQNGPSGPDLLWALQA